MKKFLFLSILIIPSIYSDVETGPDFEPGDLVTAQAFNFKFDALKGVVGEIVDADLLGNWACTSYKDGEDFSHLEANGGNGQVGNGNFYSNTGTLSLTEADTESSLNSPKNWSIDRDDVLFDSGTVQGTFSLLGNIFYTFDDQGSLAGFDIKLLSNSKIFLSPINNSQNRGLPNTIVICEIIVSEE